MKIPGEVLAIAYREIVWFKRFISEFVSTWFISVFFALAVIGLPATVSGLTPTLSRFSSVLGIEVTFLDAITMVIALSSVINVVAGVVGDVLQTLYFEFRSEEVIYTILLTTGMGRYVLATAIVRPLFISVLSTFYMLISLVLLHGLSGLALYVTLLPSLMISSIGMGFFAAAVAVLMYYYGGVKRPWIVTNLFVPAVISGSGVFIPIKLVPWYLRFIAQLTPIPYTAEAVRIYVITRGFEVFWWLLQVVAVFYSVYYVLLFSVTKISDRKVRRGA